MAEADELDLRGYFGEYEKGVECELTRSEWAGIFWVPKQPTSSILYK